MKETILIRDVYSEGSDDLAVKVQLNGYESDCELQDAFLEYVEEHDEE